jgi:hypothetical protein
MNKTKRVAWHKHLKNARRAKAKAQETAKAQAQAARGASGVHAHPTAPRSRTAASKATTPKP